MPPLQLPSGQALNPFYIVGVTKNKHFWGDKFYLTLSMRGDSAIEVEKLTSTEADVLMGVIGEAIGSAAASTQVYDDAYDLGRREGFAIGESKGHHEAYQEAHSAFWSYEREEYRINEYNLGYEAGRKQGTDEVESMKFQEGYEMGKDDVQDKLNDALTDAIDEVLEAIMRKFPLETNFTFKQVEMSLGWMTRAIRRLMSAR